MKNETKGFCIKIFDDKYVLKSDESEAHVTEAATLVDKLMNEIAEKSSITDTKKIAVLAALRLASDSVQLQGRINIDGLEQERLVELIDRVLLATKKTTF